MWEPTAVVRLNRAVAVAMADSAEAGLALVDDPELASRLEGYHLYQATRADLLRRVGRLEEAAAAYRLARAQTDNAAEHRFIDRRIQGWRRPATDRGAELARLVEPPLRTDPARRTGSVIRAQVVRMKSTTT